jgi:predicted CxxxxCH...CXXCH cytochrome family protein
MRRLILMVTLILAAPTFASAYNYWSISASTAPAIAGAITPPPNSASFTTTGSTTNVTSATVTTCDFTVNPAPAGYALSYVQIDGVTATPVTLNTYRVTKGTKINHTIVATYQTQKYTITTIPSANGLIDPTVKVVYGSAKAINITANTGYQIDTVTVIGGPAPTGFSGQTTFTYTFQNVQADKTITATFKVIPVLIARIATSPQTILVGAPLLIDGSTSTATVTPSYSWTIDDPATGAPKTGATITTGSATAQFTATAAGTFRVNLALSNPLTATSTASLDISVITYSAYQSNTCAACHTARNPQIISAYDSSPHSASLNVEVSCASCHYQGIAMQHPGIVKPVDSCNSCHLDANGNVSGHPLPIGSSPCVACHDPHSTAGTAPNITAAHFNNMTGAGYPASYVTSRSTCSDCHFVSNDNVTIRQQWAKSAHAATADNSWRQYDFKTMSGCVQCHTTTGFIAYSSARVSTAWGKSSDKTKELMTCIGCHSDITTGALRTMTPIRPYAEDTGYINPNIGKSNSCMTCHSGTKDGKSITSQLNAFADFTNLPFINPHYMAAGGTSYGQAGYHFPDRSYNGAATHTNLGSSDGSGSCVNCHKNSTYGHKFLSGAISLCAGCHGSSFDDATLSADRTAFLNALEILRAQLAANGFVYTASPPGFTNTNWGTGQAGANTMGAAFNYVLFATEPGAYTHNPTYARQLVIDSIDYLDNGQFDDSVSTLAVPNLLAAGAISQEIADSMASYKAKDTCTICHGGTAASASPMASNAHGAHITAYYGPAAYFGSGLGSCQACHVYSPATHMNGSVDLVNGAGSACAGCHPGAVPAWNGGTRLGCTGCHAQAPSVLPNGVAAPYKAYFDAKGHGQYGASNQCANCHDPDSRHISGSLGSYTRLRLLNDNNQCASCHNNPATVGAAFRNMSTHFTAKGWNQAMACVACHDPHGTTNLSMIRTTINGVIITYTDSSTGFVDSRTNQGLCQVCHTTTAHYRAGVPETSHPTSGCLSCHSHNAAGGAFKPFGTCDACHGYPPAPRRTNPAPFFGVMNNWSSARFEDYSGGGGAHLVGAHVPKTARPADGWVNCTPCHKGGAASHIMALPIKDHTANVSVLVDPQYGATSGIAPSYDTTGKTCSNVSCHSVKAGSFSYYFPDGEGDPQLTTVNYGGGARQTPAWTATGAGCTACHANPPVNGVWHSGVHGGQGPSGALNQCQFCHTDAAGSNAQGTVITNPALHANGVVNVQATFKSSCFGCH